MSKIHLYFLARYDESDIMKQSFSKLFGLSLDDMSINETIIPNISVIEISMPEERSVISTRNLNVRATNATAASKLTAFGSQSTEIRVLMTRFKNIDERENFNFLLQLLVSEPKGFSWLR